MQIDLLRDKITPAEGEISVRTYLCTYYHSRILGLQSQGYLAVTNKRVIFQACGTSNAGPSVIQSEVPIEDVSGISSYKGTYFSLGRLLSAWILSAALAGPASILLALAGSADRGFGQALGWLLLLGAFALSFHFPRESLWRSVLVTVAPAGFFGLVSSLSPLGLLASPYGLYGSYGRYGYASSGGAELAMLISVPISIYALVCYWWYARCPTFSLSISSSGGSSTPISIANTSALGIFSTAAGRALNAEPAPDAEVMLKELGAVILDIQTMGDFGINKWKTQ